MLYCLMFGLGKQKKDKSFKGKVSLDPRSRIFYYEDVPAEVLEEIDVGRKGLSLFQMQRMDVPIPPFFVVAPRVQEELFYSAFNHHLVELLEKKEESLEPARLRKLVDKAEYSNSFLEELQQQYTRLSGFGDSWVAVRSSVVCPDKPEVSFAGIFDSRLNVQGFDELKRGIKDIYTMMFTERVVEYAQKFGVSLSKLRMAVVVQKMVRSEVSGNTYTIDPVTCSPERMSIEAVFGLGDVIVDGEITPDLYILSKKDLMVEEKHISPQEWMHVRTQLESNKKAGGFVEKVKISSSWSHRQKLDDDLIQNIAKIALIIEDKYEVPQEVEWGVSGGQVWILQSNQTELDGHLKGNEVIGNDVEDRVQEGLLDLAVESLASQKEIGVINDDIDTFALPKNKNADKVVTSFDTSTDVGEEAEQRSKKMDVLRKELEHLDDLARKSRFTERSNKLAQNREREKVSSAELKKLKEKLAEYGKGSIKKTNMKLIVTGIGASFGVVEGVVKHLRSGEAFGGEVTNETVLVISKYSVEMEPYIAYAGAVILGEGGVTSDIAILCREFGTSIVVNADKAVKELVDGDTVRVDGSGGTVYLLESEKPRTEVRKKEGGASTGSEKTEPKRQSKSNGYYSDLDRLIDLKKDVRRDYEKELDEEFKSKLRVETVLDSKQLSLQRDGMTDSTDNSQKDKDYKEVSVFPVSTATKVFLALSNQSVDKDRDLLSLSDGVVGLNMDKLLLDKGIHLLAVAESGKFVEFANDVAKQIDAVADQVGGDEVIIDIGRENQGKFAKLGMAGSYENAEVLQMMYGVKRCLANIPLLKRTLKIVRRVRNVFKSRNVSLAMYSPTNQDEVIAFKKEISAAGLRRSSTFNVYVVLDKPSQVIVLDDILSADIDGVILNMHAMALDMLGKDVLRTVSSGDGDIKNSSTDVKGEQKVNGLIKVIESVMRCVGKSGVRVIVQCGNNKELIRYIVQEGIYGVATDGRFLEDVRRKVAKYEEELIIGK